MMKWSVLLCVLAIAASIWMGFNWSSSINKLRLERERVAEARNERDAFKEALIAMAQSNERAQARQDRLAAALEGISREPVTSDCGPVVHGAVERLRNNH